MRDPDENIRAKLRKYSPADESYQHPFIRKYTMESPDVPRELEEVFQNWTQTNGVMIVAPTGAGKSTFVLSILYPYVAEHGRRLLIVSNRTALNSQYKNQLLRQLNSPALKKYTPIGIQEQEEFEGVQATFCTYQGLPGLMKRLRCHEVGPFDFVVLDEAHWLVADSLFSEGSDYILEQIPRAFGKCVRVYMTATPWAVQNLIAKTEQVAPFPIAEGCYYLTTGAYQTRNPEFAVYQFPDFPRKYNLKFLPPSVRDDLCDETLLSLITNSPNEEKWVIFSSSKELGRALAKILPDAAYLDADQKSGPLWNSLVEKSRFEKRVLITTAVIENGLNINDSSVRHVVLLTTDHIQFIQELGRKRLRLGETLNVYVPNLSASQLHRLQMKNEQLYKLLQTFEKCLPEDLCNMRLDLWYHGTPEQRHLISMDGNGKLHVNQCAKQLICQRQLFYSGLEDKQAQGVSHPFLRHVCRWLSLPDDIVLQQDSWCCTTTEERQQKFLEFLDGYLDVPISGKAEQNSFSEQFRKLRVSAYGKRETGNARKDPWGIKILQDELSHLKLPYCIEGNSKTWMLRRTETYERGNFDGNE